MFKNSIELTVFKNKNIERIIQIQSNLAAEFPYLTQTNPELFDNEMMSLESLVNIQSEVRNKWGKITDCFGGTHKKFIVHNLYLVFMGKIEKIKKIKDKAYQFWLLAFASLCGYKEAFDCLTKENMGFFFRWAAEYHQNWIVTELLLWGGAKISQENKEVAWVLAAEKGYIELVEMIYGNIKNKLSDEIKLHALLHAVLNEKLDVIHFLFSHIDLSVFSGCEADLYAFSSHSPAVRSIILHYMSKSPITTLFENHKNQVALNFELDCDPSGAIEVAALDLSPR